MASGQLLDVIDIDVPGVGKCTLYPLHSLPEDLRIYSSLHNVAQELDLVDAADELQTLAAKKQLLELSCLQSFPPRFIIVVSGKHLAVPPRGPSNQTRVCVTIMKVQAESRGKKIVFSYFTSQHAVRSSMACFREQVWCIFKQKKMTQALLPYKQ